jgi:hypothetical protein
MPELRFPFNMVNKALTMTLETTSKAFHFRSRACTFLPRQTVAEGGSPSTRSRMLQPGHCGE